MHRVPLSKDNFVSLGWYMQYMFDMAQFSAYWKKGILPSPGSKTVKLINKLKSGYCWWLEAS